MTTPDTVLELRNIDFVRNGNHILHNISLTIGRGEHWALLGANGAGKSTILSMCGAQAHPTRGEVHILGSQLGRVDMQTLRQRIGHVNPRHTVRSPLTIREVVLTGLTGSLELPMRWQASAKELQRANELIQMIGLEGKADLKWPTLSQGERGRALIARALIIEPKLLLLDEPTTGLDVAAREQLLETIGQLSNIDSELSTILVTHHLEELPVSTSHAYLIAEGRMVTEGTAEEVITTENITLAFQHPIMVQQEDGRWRARTVSDASLIV